MALHHIVPRRLARPTRIAVGLLKPESRKRYIAEFARRARSRNRAHPALVCYVCHSRRVREKKVTYKQKRTFAVLICKRCGHVANPDNFNDYTKYENLEQFTPARRVGTAEQAGREYHMAKMGAEIIGRDGLKVLICGPGRSVDYRRIQQMPGVRKVAVADVVRLIDDADWVDLNKPITEKFDLVIACEVLEHFTDPPNDFAKLLGYVKDDGLALCSTNIYDGGNLNHHTYLFVKGHTSYYSPEAVVHLARKNEMLVDFRMPYASRTYAGPRKRYVFFTRSIERLQAVSTFFGKNAYGPSEE